MSKKLNGVEMDNKYRIFIDCCKMLLYNESNCSYILKGLIKVKKVSSVMLVIIMIVSAFFATGVYGADEIKVSINDKLQTYDQMPVIVEGRTLVPMRAIFESLGATVEWVDATKMVTGTKGDTVVKIQIGKNIAIVNGKAQTLDVAAQIVSGRTMVPARFVAESLGCEVGWDADTKTVLIKFDGVVAEPEKEEAPEATGSAEGTVVLSNINMKDMNVSEKAGTVKFQEGLIEAEVTTETTTQTDVYAYFKKTLNGRAKDGDICHLTFKARLLSGGKDGKGVVKVQVQADKTLNNKKVLFEEVTFGSDWTDISLPFKYEDGCNTVGIRFALALQKVEIKDVSLVNYGTSKTIEQLKAGDIGATTQSAPTSSTGATEGTAVLTNVNMKDMNVSEKAGTVKFQEGLFEADVTSETTTQTDVYAYFKKTLNDRAKTGDVCLITFKARLLSGGKDGKGIVKVQVQGDKTNNYKKTLFEEVTFGSDWTDISLPFKHEEGCNTVGIRFALAVQKVEIKDVSLVNYGTTKTIEELTKKVN